MDVLLINAHRQVPGYLPGSNLGVNILLQLARRKGYKADMLQDYAGRVVDRLSELYKESALPKIAGFYTDFNNITWTEKIIAHLKSLSPETVVIVGGPQSSGLEGGFLRSSGADVLCPGEGEESLMELLDHFLTGSPELSSIRGVGYIENGEYISIPQRVAKQDLDDIPWPDLSLTQDYSSVLFPVLTGRGCPMGCRFCYEGANAKNVRYVSCERVLDEIRRRAETDPTLKYVNFLDDTFTLKEDRVRKICDGIRELREKYDFVWFASGHVGTVLGRPGIIRYMVDSGMKKMFFGFESGSDEMLKNYNKHSTRKMIYDAVAQCKEEGLHQIAGNFILGGPFENKETLAQSEDLVDMLLDLAPGQLDTSYFSFLPYPNTPITMDPEKYGMEVYEDYIDCCMEDIPLSRTVDLSYEDLMRERLLKNFNLQKKMRQIYLDGKVPEEVILNTYEDHNVYMIYSKWMDYVYSHYPVDHAYWRMRAIEGYRIMKETKDPKSCFVSRTFEIWNYYDTKTGQLLGVGLGELEKAVLKLCNGKFTLGELLDKLSAKGYEVDAVMSVIRDFEDKKWILFTEI